MCLCVYACVRARVCMRACVHAFMSVHVCRLSGLVVMLVRAFTSKVFWTSTRKCFDVVCVVCD